MLPALFLCVCRLGRREAPKAPCQEAAALLLVLRQNPRCRDAAAGPDEGALVLALPSPRTLQRGPQSLLLTLLLLCLPWLPPTFCALTLRCGTRKSSRSPNRTDKCFSPSSHQAECGEDVLIVAHQVDLPDGSQRLFLRNLGGTGRQPQPLAADADRAAADDDDVVACRSLTKMMDAWCEVVVVRDSPAALNQGRLSKAGGSGSGHCC